MGVDALLKDPVGQRYHWVTNGEPHSLRRREILDKYGDQIKKLYGYDHATAWQVSSGGGLGSRMWSRGRRGGGARSSWVAVGGGALLRRPCGHALTELCPPPALPPSLYRRLCLWWRSR